MSLVCIGSRAFISCATHLCSQAAPFPFIPCLVQDHRRRHRAFGCHGNAYDDQGVDRRVWFGHICQPRKRCAGESWSMFSNSLSESHWMQCVCCIISFYVFHLSKAISSHFCCSLHQLWFL